MAGDGVLYEQRFRGSISACVKIDMDSICDALIHTPSMHHCTWLHSFSRTHSHSHTSFQADTHSCTLTLHIIPLSAFFRVVLFFTNNNLSTALCDAVKPVRQPVNPPVTHLVWFSATRLLYCHFFFGFCHCVCVMWWLRCYRLWMMFSSTWLELIVQSQNWWHKDTHQWLYWHLVLESLKYCKCIIIAGVPDLIYKMMSSQVISLVCVYKYQ